MESSPRTAPAFITRGAAAYEAGNLEEARSHFVEALRIDPDYELAWIWLATVVENRGQERYCLDRALAINPDSVAKARRQQLKDVEPEVPNEIFDLASPPVPTRYSKTTPKREVAARTVQRSKATLRRSSVAGEKVSPTDGDDELVVGWSNRTLLLTGFAALALLALLGWWLYQRVDDPDTLYIAFAGDLSGDTAGTTRQQVESIDLYLDQLNQDGGIDGNRVELVTFDDKDEPDLAVQRAREIVDDDRNFLLVIGHTFSGTSIAASPIYEEAGIPAISPVAIADELTIESPWYFRTIYNGSTQGSLMALYAANALGYDRASVIYRDDPYGITINEGFEAQFSELGGTIGNAWTVDVDVSGNWATAIADQLAAEDDPGILMLFLQADVAEELIVALHDRGLSPQMFGSNTLSTTQFTEQFNKYVPAGAPLYTDGMYVAAPFIDDSLGAEALRFAFDFEDRYNQLPNYQAAKAQEAILMAANAIGVAVLDEGDASVEARRMRVRDQLASIDTIEEALPGIGQPLYFDETGSLVQSLSVGQLIGNEIPSAPIQYRVVDNPDLLDLDAELEAGNIVEINGRYLRELRVVYTGLDMNEIRDFDTSDQTFHADFFLWFRYLGDDDVTNIEFINSVTEGLELGDPITTDELDGVHYRVYRVRDTFRNALDFHDYPWDTQNLTIRFQNQLLDGTEVVYVVDELLIAQPQSIRLLSGSDTSQPFDEIPNWSSRELNFYQDTVTSSSALGDPSISSAAAAITYSQFVADTVIERDVRGFLTKNLLPLALLALVTYISLFFPADQAGAKVGFAVTAILTSAVMLDSISNHLPEIGYTVAIEWGFYVYIGLAAFLVIVNILIERFYKQKRLRTVKRLEVASRIIYPAVILVTVAYYVSRFGSS